jgi:CRP-like cAMP-binding protein
MDQGFVKEKLTHQEIARHIGSSREVVSRMMKMLSDGGYISAEKKAIKILKKLPLKF